MSNTAPKSGPQQAILYLLNRINKTPELAWYFVATESHSRLMEAAAELTGEQLAEIKAIYSNPKTVNPSTGAIPDQFSLNADIPSLIDMRDIEEYMDKVTCEERLQMFQYIKMRFCPRCGGNKGASLYCGCNIGRRGK